MTHDEFLQRGRTLVANVLRDSGDGHKYNELLRMFHNGLSLSLLDDLLRCTNERDIVGALFIVEELGKMASPLVKQVVTHVQGRAPKVRRAAYSALCSCIPDGGEQDFVYVVHGMLDPDLICRRTAMLWTMRVPDSWLRAALLSLSGMESESILRDALQMLLGESSQNTSQIKDWLSGSSPWIKKIGAIAAARVGDQQPELLELASRSDDSEVSAIATIQIRFREIAQRHLKRKVE